LDKENLAGTRKGVYSLAPSSTARNLVNGTGSWAGSTSYIISFAEADMIDWISD
jgi:hypothetical protein